MTKIADQLIQDGIMYYVEDTSRLQGNTKFWWIKNDWGYTPDVRCARAWFGFEIKGELSNIDQDLRAWPVKYINGQIIHSISNMNVEEEGGTMIKPVVKKKNEN